MNLDKQECASVIEDYGRGLSVAHVMRRIVKAMDEYLPMEAANTGECDDLYDEIARALIEARKSWSDQ